MQRRHLAAIASMAAATVLLGGCSSGGEDKERPSAGEATQQATQTTSPQDLPTVPQIKDFAGAAKDVQMGECSTDEGENTVEGTVSNPTQKAQDYVITVSWVTPRSDVVGRGVAEIEGLGAGEEQDWSLTGSLAGTGEYSCTLNVQRGSLSS